MSVFAPTPTQAATCKGKAGRSKPHPHYAGHRQVFVKHWGYATRCTSCGSVVVWADADDPTMYQPVELTLEFALAFVQASL